MYYCHISSTLVPLYDCSILVPQGCYMTVVRLSLYMTVVH
jgi:hypothetical protein